MTPIIRSRPSGESQRERKSGCLNGRTTTNSSSSSSITGSVQLSSNKQPLSSNGRIKASFKRMGLSAK